jgi:starch-binding outer membrane protein, SusD/RagB family
MKHININKYIGTALLALFLAGCSNVLEEKPRAIFTPEYFSTQAGVMGGITSMYGHLRYMYGNGYFLNVGQIATDEATWGQNSDGNIKNLDFSGVGTINPSTSNTGAVWNNAFPNINTASGVIENASKIGTISNSLIAEARFFRAFDYFLLVQTYGGVPLDLGAGELKFNTSTSRYSKRNTVPEVYSKAIFPDLLISIKDLPASGRVTGGLTKTAARLILAKAYLTFGWWLENPNNIPTYPLCDRKDLDGHNAAWYYQQAYDVATAAIADPGSFGLQSTFYDVSDATKDRNKEMVLYADHTQSSATYNGGDLGYSGGGFSTDNFASWFEQFSYPNIRSSSTSTGWSAVSSVQRAATQPLGRPWTMLAPPIAVFKNTFADKTNDSRYDGTFTTVYRSNWVEAGLKVNGAIPKYLYNANSLPIMNGDPVLTFLDTDMTGIDYTNSAYNSAIGAGVLPGRADFVIEPGAISRICFPNNWKLGPYRTDNNGGLGSPNGSSTRPFPVAKFSELYFVAAEAAVKGATTQAGKSAKDLINVIRARAGKWSFSNAGNVAKVQDNSAAMIAATPAIVDVDYILAERSREYFGEGYRWYDLARTQKWLQYGATVAIAGSTNANDWKDHTVKTVTRTMTSANYLRPIPTSQLDAMEMSADEKKAYQNPGY